MGHCCMSRPRRISTGHHEPSSTATNEQRVTLCASSLSSPEWLRRAGRGILSWPDATKVLLAEQSGSVTLCMAPCEAVQIGGDTVRQCFLHLPHVQPPADAYVYVPKRESCAGWTQLQIDRQRFGVLDTKTHGTGEPGVQGNCRTYHSC